MKVLVLPRDRNPYQASLYGAAARQERLQIRYLSEVTSRYTLNLLLLPLELLVARLRGYRVLHLHWVFGFRLPLFAERWFSRRLMRAWFGLFLLVARLGHVRVVWIAHNVLPHEQIFDDDVAGRRILLRSASAVLAHSAETLEQLDAIAPPPALRAVARHPAFDVAPCGEVRSAAPLPILYFGYIKPAKGVPDLLRALPRLHSPVTLTVIGQCDLPWLRAEIEQLAAGAATVRFDRVPDAELHEYLCAAALVVLPFRQVTTSGSAFYALSAGRPLLVPDVPTLHELPREACLFYPAASDPVDALAASLDQVAASPDRLAAMGRAGRDWALRYTWDDLAGDLLGLSRSVTSS